MQNLYEDLVQLLVQDDRLTTEGGALLRNRIIELGLKLDVDLLRLLLSHDRIKKHFFAQVDDVLVFDKDKFLQFVNNKQFLPDSYTAFKNKIGLSDDGGDTYLSRHRDVTLVWPYKDCVLEGGQTEEDAKRDEVFWNTTLAPDDIDRLLDPKVLTNFRCVDANGEHPADQMKPEDSLVIKGNNLLALHSLVRRFGGQVKLIYIDPPYNTGNDSFGYNDRFNHSTWLTFMRSRLEAARALLRSDGSIWINIDDNESHYLKVLCDEVWGRDNFVTSISWRKKVSPSNDATWFSSDHDYILVYAKYKSQWNLNRLPMNERQRGYYTNPDNDPRGDWNSATYTCNKSIEERPNLYYPIINPNTGKTVYPSRTAVWAYSEEKHQEHKDLDLLYWGKQGTSSTPRLKKFLSDAGDVVPRTIWDYGEVGHTQEAKRETIALSDGDVFATPKPERLLKRILHIGSNPGDLVVDFFAGSGTTGAVALKMGRCFALVEQMDHLDTITVPRLEKAIAGEQGGISDEVGWQGGGDFMYCELLQWNERYVQRIECATSTDELWALWQEMQDHAFLSYKVDVAVVNEHAADFSDLTLDEQKVFLLEVLDHNALYVNLSEIDDAQYGVSEEDKHLNSQFYGMITE